MAIIADYIFQGIPLKDVYIRPQSIGGAKNYNWACTFAVFANEELSRNFDNNLNIITIRLPWAENQDIYTDAYIEMSKHSELINVRRG